MLRVQIDICPYGDESAARRIYTCEIGNVSDGEVANYIYELYEHSLTGRRKRTPVVSGRHEGHLRSDGAVPLVAKVLGAAAQSMLAADVAPNTERDPAASLVGFEDEHLDELDDGAPIPYWPSDRCP